MVSHVVCSFFVCSSYLSLLNNMYATLNNVKECPDICVMLIGVRVCVCACVCACMCMLLHDGLLIKIIGVPLINIMYSITQTHAHTHTMHAQAYSELIANYSSVTSQHNQRPSLTQQGDLHTIFAGSSIK